MASEREHNRCEGEVKSLCAKSRGSAVAARIDGSVDWLSNCDDSGDRTVSDLTRRVKIHLVSGRLSSPSIDATETSMAASGPKSTAAKRMGNSEIDTLSAPETSTCPL